MSYLLGPKYVLIILKAKSCWGGRDGCSGGEVVVEVVVMVVEVVMVMVVVVVVMVVVVVVVVLNYVSLEDAEHQEQ